MYTVGVLCAGGILLVGGQMTVESESEGLLLGVNIEIAHQHYQVFRSVLVLLEQMDDAVDQHF